MKCLLRWCITIILLSNFVTSQCPKGKLCEQCNRVPGGIFETVCSKPVAHEDRRFLISLKPYSWLNIICDTNANWDHFHLGEEEQVEFIESISFKLCPLPPNRTFGNIVRQIVNGDVRVFKYQSYKNLTTQLNRITFKGLKGIEVLVLSHNNLTKVPVDLLRDLIHLKHLDISWNRLEELTTGFLDLPSLEVIDLSHNKLKVMGPGLFKMLVNLKTLDLKSNFLTELGATGFENLKSLTYLNLTENNLEGLPSDVFGQLTDLKVVHLSRNNFTSEGIPPDLFRNNRLLESVAMTDNKRQLHSLPNNTFGDLKNLIAVDLTGNGFLRLPEDLFTRATNLQNISLARNRIREIPKDLLTNCEAIRRLDLSVNEITDLPVDMFNLLDQLEVLDVSRNRLKEFNNAILDYVTSLKVLNLANNQIEQIRSEGICVLLNIRTGNRDIGKVVLGSGRKEKYPFRNDGVGAFLYCARNIERVYLHGNRLQDPSSGWLFSEKLQVVTLHDNWIKNISMEDVQFYSGNTRVTYDGNHIESILFGEEDDFGIHAESLRLDFGSNPINCDCRLHGLLRFRDGEMSYHVHSKLTIDMEKLKCAQPEELRDTRVEQLNRMALKCLVEEPSTLNATCPEKCQCWQRPEDRGYLIDCSYRNLTKAPESLQSPEGYHIELNLTGNLITEMPSMNQSGYQNVTKLILSKNDISIVNVTSLSETLKVLTLDSNNLTKLEPQVLDFLKNSTTLKHLDLHHNPWICNCDTVDLLKFIQTMIPKVPDLRSVTCESSEYPIYQMVPEDICPVVVGPLIIIGTTVAIMGIFIGSIAAFYYRYQHEIKVWLYAKQWCLWFVTEDELDKDRVYDAFISFSQLDAPFITEILVPTLEEGPHAFHLCIHYRDWIPGEPIPNQIANSVNDSKRTIIVLSTDFLESVWGRVEFRTAHEQALSEGRTRVIVILYGDIDPVNDLDSELKAYLSMNTYVKWGDPWFWEKLRYALPHPNNWLRKKRKYKDTERMNPITHYLNNKNAADSNANVHISM